MRISLRIHLHRCEAFRPFCPRVDCEPLSPGPGHRTPSDFTSIKTIAASAGTWRWLTGSGSRARTCDIRCQRPMLYQLSYSTINWRSVKESNPHRITAMARFSRPLGLHRPLHSAKLVPPDGIEPHSLGAEFTVPCTSQRTFRWHNLERI